jgi:hypothetical protein
MNESQKIINSIKSKIERELDSSFLSGFVNELKQVEENKLSIDKSEPKLQFDNSHNLDISAFFSKYSPL